MEILKSAAAALLLLGAVYADIKNGKIYNKMTFPGMAFGISGLYAFSLLMRRSISKK